jgi:hypothetical protein
MEICFYNEPDENTLLMNRSLILLLVIVILVTGCNLFRSAQEEAAHHSVTPLSMQSPVSAMHAAAAGFPSLSYGAQLIFNMEGSENSVNANVRILKDSIVWVSARKFGFEIARLMLSNDSVWLLDRINNRYFAGDYGFFSRQFNLEADYNMLEAILLGNPLDNWSMEPFNVDCSVPELCLVVYPSRYRINQGRDGRMRPEGSTVTRQEIGIHPANGKIVRNSIEVTEERRRIVAVYDRFTPVEEILLPADVHVTIIDQENELSFQIVADTFKIGDSLSFPFQIPKNYKSM